MAFLSITLMGFKNEYLKITDGFVVLMIGTDQFFFYKLGIEVWIISVLTFKKINFLKFSTGL